MMEQDQHGMVELEETNIEKSSDALSYREHEVEIVVLLSL